MLRREGSRPRLVSDEDCAFRNAAANNEKGDRNDLMPGSVIQGRGQLVATADGISKQLDAYDDESSFVSCLEMTPASRSNSYGDLRTKHVTDSSLSLHDWEMDLKSSASFNLFDDQDDCLDSSHHADIDNHCASTKRKRLSNYMTPACSYVSLAVNQHPAPYQPLSTHDNSNQKLVTDAHSFQLFESIPQLDQLSLQSLPEEIFVIIASFLAIPQVRSLAVTNHAIRATLMTSQAALDNIWTNVLRDAFPRVFLRTNIKRPSGNDRHETNSMIASSEVHFVDSLHMPLTGLISGTQAVNLSLLTGLLPKTYPRRIDPITLRMDSHLHPFESYHMSISSHEKRYHEQQAEKESYSVDVPVIQFVGRVGMGDRCIRADQPFPSVRKCAIGEDINSRIRSFHRLSSILRTRRLDYGTTSARIKHPNGVRSKKWDRGIMKWANANTNYNASVEMPTVNSQAGHVHPSAHTFTINSTFDQQPPLTPLGFLTFTPPSQETIPSQLSPPPPPQPQNLLVTPHPHSPLFRFLSSLSHRCDSVSSTSSMNDRNAGVVDESHRSSESVASMLFEQDAEFGQEENDDEIGLNNYGVRVKLSLTKCRERLGKLSRHGCKCKQAINLRPFVTPIVISQCGRSHNMIGSKDGNSSPDFYASPQTKLVVDLTPRLCAYFEITILKHSKREGSNGPNSRSSGRSDVTLRNVDHLTPRVQPRPHRMLHADQQWENNAWHWRIPPPVLLPIHPLVNMAILEGPGLTHVYDRDFRPRSQMERVLIDNNGVHRHECVAIGLSTLKFSPRDKMPGWDDHSYGYHGDDGGIFHGQGEMIKRYGPPFGPGDTVGCGVEYSSRRIFFAKNGKFLGLAFDMLPENVIERGLYPTVGVDTECPLFVNFGEQPFCFDLSTFAKVGCQIMEG
ncbi:hypothetical protein ACHAW6_004197 [Cyclotella cf. meneghiniana]